MKHSIQWGIERDHKPRGGYFLPSLGESCDYSILRMEKFPSLIFIPYFNDIKATNVQYLKMIKSSVCTCAKFHNHMSSVYLAVSTNIFITAHKCHSVYVPSSPVFFLQERQ